MMESREIGRFDEAAAVPSTLLDDAETFLGMEAAGDRCSAPMR
jgi:hypothetical protein